MNGMPKFKIRNDTATSHTKPITPSSLGEIWATNIAILPESSNGTKSLTSVEHPQSDGLVERLNKTLKTGLVAMVGERPNTWDDLLPFVTILAKLLEETDSYHSRRGQDNIKTAQAHQKKFYYKKSRVKQDYKIGDLILRKSLEKLTFPKERWSGPWIIIDKNNEGGSLSKYKTKRSQRPYFYSKRQAHAYLVF
ncbi:hypothetical protein BD560DRAFT_429264 [Blakeslea trispora]|nr:hypothetical protein BD560DRAFT_429264 [Blakeslea trispora]